jgi:hypothetical protein
MVDCNCDAGKLLLRQLAAVIRSTVPSDFTLVSAWRAVAEARLVCSIGTQIKALSASKSKLVKVDSTV